MSLSAWEQQALDSIKDGLAGSDPQLTALMIAFTELASGEKMPTREKVRPSSCRAVERSYRERRYQGWARARRMYQHLMSQWALLSWLSVTAALIGIALALSHDGGQMACTGSWSTICAAPAPASSSPPAWHGAVASHVNAGNTGLRPHIREVYSGAAAWSSRPRA